MPCGSINRLAKMLVLYLNMFSPGGCCNTHEDLHQLLDFMVGFRVFLWLISFPETINIEDLQRPQLILCLEYVEDISIGDGLQEKVEGLIWGAKLACNNFRVLSFQEFSRYDQLQANVLKWWIRWFQSTSL